MEGCVADTGAATGTVVGALLPSDPGLVASGGLRSGVAWPPIPWSSIPVALDPRVIYGPIGGTSSEISRLSPPVRILAPIAKQDLDGARLLNRDANRNAGTCANRQQRS
jgi:hypothetical protein